VDKIGTVNKKDIEEVHDVAQLQVIIHLHKDQDTTLYGTGSQLCYHIMGLVHTKWAPIPGSIKDYIATPKTNGYQVGLPAGCAESLENFAVLKVWKTCIHTVGIRHQVNMHGRHYPYGRQHVCLVDSMHMFDSTHSRHHACSTQQV